MACIIHAKQLVANGAIGEPVEAEFISHFNLERDIPFGWSHRKEDGGDVMNKVFKHPLTYESGHLVLDDTPGLGVDFDENEAKKHPYKRSYLPVSRLEDGTLWDW